MEFFNNISRERFTAIAENYINDILDNRGNNIEDLASAFSNAGFTKSEFFAILDKYYLDDYNWTTETVPVPSIEDVSVGDTDQAILETALTQIGIPYSWESSRDGDGGWLDLKATDGEKTTNLTAVEIYFSKEGNFIGTH